MRTRNIISEVVRKVLLENPKGMTVRELAKTAGYTQDKVIACLQRNYGFYISEYIPNPSGYLNLSSVWCCVPVPANPPKPPLGSLIVDEIRADEERRKLAKREQKQRERLLQKRANDKIRAAAKAAKERLKQLKAAPPDYVPEKTVWVKVPTWSSVGASA
jgi:hypothetical protein